MTIEGIRKRIEDFQPRDGMLLSDLNSIIQCQLLLLILDKLERIESDVDEIEKVVYRQANS